MQGKDARSAAQAVYIGCDVSKRWIDVHAHPIGKSWRVTNDKQAISALKHTPCQGKGKRAGRAGMKN